MLSVNKILAKSAKETVAVKTAEEIATGLAAADKAVNYSDLVITRIGTNGLYEHTIVGTEETAILKEPCRQFFTIYVNDDILVDVDGNVNKYFYCSLYELIGILKQSPMAAFFDVVANDPKLAAILLPGAHVSVCAEVAESGDYTNPFGKEGNVSTLKADSVIHHMYNLGTSSAAKAAMEMRAEKLAKF